MMSPRQTWPIVPATPRPPPQAAHVTFPDPGVYTMYIRHEIARSEESAMRATICKWGNSLGLRIPRGLAEDAGLAEGSVVELRLEDGRLVAEPVTVEKL